MTISRSDGIVKVTPALFFASTLLLLRLQCAQIVVQSIEARDPEAAIAFEPVVDGLEGGRLDPARPPLRLAAARDEARALQHLEMLGDGREAHVEGFRQLGHRGFARREPRQDGPARGVGEGCEGGAETIHRHPL